MMLKDMEWTQEDHDMVEHFYTKPPTIKYTGMTNGKPSFTPFEDIGGDTRTFAKKFLKGEVQLWDIYGGGRWFPSPHEIASIASNWWGYRKETQEIIDEIKQEQSV